VILEFNKQGSKNQFMVELEHEPETCVASGRSDVQRNAKLLIDLRERADDYDVKIVGGWAFPIGHKLWYVVEASGSHAVAELLFAVRVHSWNTVDIHPVLPHDTFAEDVLKPLTPGVD
jgi:hypothetical protein